MCQTGRSFDRPLGGRQAIAYRFVDSRDDGPSVAQGRHYHATYRIGADDLVAGGGRARDRPVGPGRCCLREGTHDQSFEIQLTPAELAAHQLDISLSLQGRGRITQCNADNSVAAVVEIEPESGLRLALDGPVETALDRLLLTGGRVPVA